MSDEELKMLSNLLVKYYQQITPERCSFYGWKMDRALCKDLHVTLHAHGLGRLLTTDPFAELEGANVQVVQP